MNCTALNVPSTPSEIGCWQHCTCTITFVHENGEYKMKNKKEKNQFSKTSVHDGIEIAVLCVCNRIFTSQNTHTAMNVCIQL